VDPPGLDLHDPRRQAPGLGAIVGDHEDRDPVLEPAAQDSFDRPRASSSSAAVGSSSNKACGACSRARASARRCRSPLESRAIGHASTSTGSSISVSSASARPGSVKCAPTRSAHQPDSAGT
jgi:hypothetical protein